METTISELEKRIKQVESQYKENDAKMLLKPYYTILNEFKTKKRTDPEQLNRAYIMLGGLLK